ncbi:MAG: VWA domain-containing protein [Bacillota bacterium]
MLDNILVFIDILRKSGLKISNSEVRDFMEALSIIGFERDEFIYALEATLAKQEIDRDIILKLFNLFINEIGCSINKKLFSDAAKTPPRLNKAEFQNKLDMLKSYIRNEIMLLKDNASCPGQSCRVTGSRITGHLKKKGKSDKITGGIFVSTILNGNTEDMRLLVRNAMERLPDRLSEDNSFLNRIKADTGWAEGEEILERMINDKKLSRWEAVSRIEQFRDAISGEYDRRQWKSNRINLISRYNINDISFNRVDYEQAREIKLKLVRLGRKLATKKGYRFAASGRGQVDLRRTAALAGIHGGVPVKLLMRDRIPTKPEIVILCDLSGSVSNFSRFMLLLVSAMQDKFRSVRSYAFVDSVEEITALLRGWDAEKKISEVYRNTKIWQTGFSDYGAVWTIFYEKYREVVTSKTTLIILGDARNNYKPDGIDCFIRIATKAKRVLWLNPAPNVEWNREDSIISRYAPHCSRVLECGNISQLEKVSRLVFI